MTEEEHRHGMTEFHTRLTRVEERAKSMQSELTDFKRDFHEHHTQEREDRKEILKEQKATVECLNEIKTQLGEMRGWKIGFRAGVTFVIMFVGGMLTLTIKKLLGL